MLRPRTTDAITRTEPLAVSARRGRRRTLASRVASAAALCFIASVSLSAHDPGLSALDVRIDDREIVAVLSLAAADAASMGGASGVLALARNSIEVSMDQRALPSTAPSLWLDERGGVYVRVAFPATSGSRLTVRSGIVPKLARGHRELLSIRTTGDGVLAERMLDSESHEVSVDVSAPVCDSGSSFRRFFAMGVEHILGGYDHLLFLAGVLVVLRRWADVFRTITAFTVAHSITLALATAGMVRVPGAVVEPLIAASIVYVGVENLFRQVQGSRWQLTFGFGLIHGLGFATALGDVGVGTSGHSGIFVPLASFNAGVEAGHVAVAAAFVPLLWRASRVPALHGRLSYAWSLLVVAAGGYWLIDRLV